MRENLHNRISSFLLHNFDLKLLFLNYLTSNNLVSASFIADFISLKLKKRVPFRKVIKDSVLKIKQFSYLIKGFKIQISGRLNGAEIARTEWIREGRVPLHTLSALIDYYFLKVLLFLLFKVWKFKIFSYVIFFSFKVILIYENYFWCFRYKGLALFY